MARLNFLRLLLLIAAVGWGATAIGVVLPWDVAIDHLQTLGGAGPIPDDPMLRYWLRMASGAFGMIGVMFLVAAWKPHNFANIIQILALLNIVEGAILLFYGIKLELGPFPFLVDISIAFIPGCGILLLRNSINSNR